MCIDTLSINQTDSCLQLNHVTRLLLDMQVDPDELSDDWMTLFDLQTNLKCPVCRLTLDDKSIKTIDF